MTPTELPNEELDELSQEWLNALCEQALHDDKLRSAVEMVSSLHTSMLEGQPVPSTHQPMLRQMLAAAAILKVQEIGWAVEIQQKSKQQGDDSIPV
ncbi:hypothetical protein [Xylophilus rhododendri]|nr:hypothetical protein [Xylophilus rhododendri]